MTIAPISFEWDGEAMIPLNPRLADRQYVVHEKYRLIPHEERSANSHRHYFAAVREAFENLPENVAENFASQDHLRKWALIRVGYRDERTIACSSKAEAQRVAAFCKPMDEYAVVVVREATVYQWTAQSQSMRAMGKKKFQDSKTKVLDILAEMIGTDTRTLQQNVGKAA